jgi:uncharacterized protein
MSSTIRAALEYWDLCGYYGIYLQAKLAKDEDAALFDWDEDNVSHVRGNGIEPHEAEEAILDPGRVSVFAYNVSGERRWALLGATEPGDLLFIVYTRRHGRIRVVTARMASDREKRRYRTRGK